MKVITSTTTVAAYCDEMLENKIIVNKDYQRSSKVWPNKARSYLIDTILLGFPIPKLSLYQTTDLKSRKTIKEIVDGQQRSMAIQAFMENEFKISGNSEYAGKTFSKLDEDIQRSFLEYQISLDIFIGATQSDIRQTFRRINSYNVPLNAPELRHATFQGDFKWFMVSMLDHYSQVLKTLGAFNESQLARMRDANLLSEVVMATQHGIESASDKKLDVFYQQLEDKFGDAALYESLFEQAFSLLLTWNSLHDGPLVKPYNLYALLLAIFHKLHPFEALKSFVIDNVDAVEKNDETHDIGKQHKQIQDPDTQSNRGQTIIDTYESVVALGELANSLQESGETLTSKKYEDFVKANSAATNRVNQRITMFQYFYASLK